MVAELLQQLLLSWLLQYRAIEIRCTALHEAFLNDILAKEIVDVVWVARVENAPSCSDASWLG